MSKLTGVWDVGVPPVRVTRSRAARGYTWRVVFVGVYGDVGPLTADDTYLVGDDARIEVATLQDGDCDVLPGGFSYEVQTVYLASLSPVTGSFTLNFEGQETGPIAVGATAAEVKARLEALDTIFATNVRMEDLDTNLNTRAWTVTFTHQRHTLTQGAADANLMVGTTNFGETTAEVHVT